MRAEGHQRLVLPLYTIVFALVALAALLHGSVHRFGRILRLGIAVLAVAALQGGSFALQSLTARMPALVPLMYVVPLAAGAASLLALLAPLRSIGRGLPQGPVLRRLSPA
jgi:lipopolysaccharide export system permease protein